MTNSVYKLWPITDDPRYGGFGFRDTASLLGNLNIYRDFSPLTPVGPNWKPNRLAPLWKPRAVVGLVQPTNDYPTVGFVPAFSQRAVDSLQDMLVPNGEILPLHPPEGLGPYSVYNTITMSDALDEQRSEIDWGGNRDQYLARRVNRYELLPERLEGQSIFRLPALRSDVYVTDAFATRVRECRLQGFDLIRVWPIERESDRRQLPATTFGKMPGRGEPQTCGATVPGSLIVGRMRARPFQPGEEHNSFKQALRDYPNQLDFDPTSTSIDQIQTRIHSALQEIYTSDLDKENKLNRAFWLAFAWGETLARTLKWEWAILEDEAGHKTPAVVSPNRAYAVAVLQYIGRLATEQADQTSHLLYNMILANDLTPAQPGELRLLA